VRRGGAAAVRCRDVTRPACATCTCAVTSVTGDVAGWLSSAQGRRGILPVLANGGVSPGLAKVAMGVQWVAHEGV